MNDCTPIRFLCQGLLALSFALSGAVPAHGQGVPGYPADVRYGFDPREVALLPRYCTYTQLFRAAVPGGNDYREKERWTLIMGDAFNHMHHYCWGLMDTNRALFLVRTERWRKYYLGLSIGEFDYVIDRAPDDMVLLPEILTKKCENLSRLDRGSQAERASERAIALKPDYWPAYAAISGHYKGMGDLAKAREWLEKGLSVTPDVKALTRRLAELEADKERRTAALQSGVPKSTAER
jgi:tetratricopeptide (TPR) repeat protein